MGGERRGVGGAIFLVGETAPQKDMVSDTSFEAEVGLGLETRVYCRCNQTGEERARMIGSRKEKDKNWFSINDLEMLGMVMRTFVMIVIRRKRPARVGKPW